MAAPACSRCRAVSRLSQQSQHRLFTTSATRHQDEQRLDVKKLLQKPTWSVRSLAPLEGKKKSKGRVMSMTEITPEKLHHLLRLSALPQPSSPEEEASMLKTLHTQLHFVRDIQSVNTDGVEPLRSLRDESDEGIKAATIGLATPEIKEALEMEKYLGRNMRPRRQRERQLLIKDEEGKEDEKMNKKKSRKQVERAEKLKEARDALKRRIDESAWDPFSTATKREGDYFVVSSGKE